MNSIAVNPEGDFFSHAARDPALFHSILYLVALNYDLKMGLKDSPECLYHGGLALKIINERLSIKQEDLNYATIAAVAILATKEVKYPRGSI